MKPVLMVTFIVMMSKILYHTQCKCMHCGLHQVITYRGVPKHIVLVADMETFDIGIVTKTGIKVELS